MASLDQISDQSDVSLVVRKIQMHSNPTLQLRFRELEFRKKSSTFLHPQGIPPLNSKALLDLKLIEADGSIFCWLAA